MKKKENTKTSKLSDYRQNKKQIKNKQKINKK